MTIIYGTGFEAGSNEIVPAVDSFDRTQLAVIAAPAPHAGLYSMQINDGAGGINWVRFGDFSTSYTELYMSSWMQPDGTAKGLAIEFELTDNVLIGIRKDSGIGNQEAKGYVNGVLVETSATDWIQNYTLVEMYVKVASSGGRVLAKFNGVTVIDYIGNTKPTAATDIQYLRFSMDNGTGDWYRIDDITVKTDAFPGDIRYIDRVPDGDSAVTWTPSAGGTNFNLVDEVPPNDGDYVSTAVSANQDLYTVEDYTLSSAISHIVQWIRANTSPAGGEIKSQVESGATTSEEESSGLGTTAEYLWRILETDPNTSAVWSKTGFNAALFGQESVVTAETVTVFQHVIEIAYDQDASTLVRPLGISVDLESGSRTWVTVWDNDVLFLKRYPAALTPSTDFNFGAATEAEVDARTFYLVPYTPPFFATASLDDIIYVFGRWDDTAVTHLEKSTDGGSTFVDIGDSATWLTGWVGAFFATDASNLYAFVNGASRALYRSINGGTNWSSLSSLPFDVDADSISLHADGRIIIANRAAAAQMVAYADGPDYGSWTNATGSPAFPTAGGGGRSLVWIV
jgi:hypothetical protein